MKAESHMEKAKAIERDFKRVESDSVKAECLFGIALNYIAFITEKRIGKHQDIHKGLYRFLIENGFPELAGLWNEIEQIRQGGWYGRQGFPARGYEILDKIKGEVENV